MSENVWYERIFYAAFVGLVFPVGVAIWQLVGGLVVSAVDRESSSSDLLDYGTRRAAALAVMVAAILLYRNYSEDQRIRATAECVADDVERIRLGGAPEADRLVHYCWKRDQDGGSADYED